MLRLTNSPEQTVAVIEQDVSTAMTEVLEEFEGAKGETEAREVDFPSEVLEIESSKVSSRSPGDSEELPETLTSAEDSSYYTPGCGPGSTGRCSEDRTHVPNVFRTNVFRTCSEFRSNGGGPNVVSTMSDAANVSNGHRVLTEGPNVLRTCSDRTMFLVT
tara:strand:- start:1936 stop:2415 length:480 start_codon:yes stop_codon:yes gene_type:complete